MKALIPNPTQAAGYVNTIRDGVIQTFFPCEAKETGDVCAQVTQP